MPSLPWPLSRRTNPNDMPKNSPSGDIQSVISGVSSLPPHVLALSALIVGSVSALGARYIYGRYFRRIPTAEWVTPRILAKKRWIKGYVTSVGDADNFRLYHTPGIGWSWPLKFRRIPVGRDLKDQTISIRMAGVDAPEGSHFGRPAQAFAQESLAWLKSHAEGKTVYCQLTRRDQYGRIVAIPCMKPRLLPGFVATGKCLSLEMLRAGWVEVYEQAGAEYGRWGKDELLRIQAEAQAARRGIWKYGINIESAADYKRRYTAAAEVEPPSKTVTNAKKASKRSLLRRFLPWSR